MMKKLQLKHKTKNPREMSYFVIIRNIEGETRNIIIMKTLHYKAISITSYEEMIY